MEKPPLIVKKKNRHVEKEVFGRRTTLNGCLKRIVRQMKYGCTYREEYKLIWVKDGTSVATHFEKIFQSASNPGPRQPTLKIFFQSGPPWSKTQRTLKKPPKVRWFCPKFNALWKKISKCVMKVHQHFLVSTLLTHFEKIFFYHIFWNWISNLLIVW